MTEPILLPAWVHPGWLETVQQWLTQKFNQLGLTAREPAEILHARPWSVVLAAQTSQGRVYFKACAPVLGYEAGLTNALFGWRPDCILRVLAVDEPLGWLLMADESPMLRQTIQTPADLQHWEQILPLLAGFQQEMAPRSPQLLALSVPDRRLVHLPALMAGLLEERPALLIDQPDGLTAQQYQHLHELLPRFEAMCSELAALGIPETLHHEDFHDANIFFPGGRYVFSDWGESCLAHPFFTLLVGLRSIAYRFDLAYGAAEHNFEFDPHLLRLRDIYLEAWSSYGTRADLLHAFDLAWKIAMVNRALTWQRVLAAVPEAERASRAYTVPAWLQEFLDM